MAHESLDEITAEELEHTFRTNVFGNSYLTQAAVPHLRPGAVILSTTSTQAYEPSEQLPVYAATKAAFASLTKSYTKLAERGVRVNGAAPGPVWTPLIPATMPAEKVAKFGENTVFERPAQPIELAKVFVFLASDDASYVSGESLRSCRVSCALRCSCIHSPPMEQWKCALSPGMARAFVAMGHTVVCWQEHDCWSQRSLIESEGERGSASLAQFSAAYPELTIREHAGDRKVLADALKSSEVAIVHEWNSPVLVATLLATAKYADCRTLFHDTHHRASSTPEQIRRMQIQAFDGVLAC